ncbi:MAG: hypothetical protein DME86_07930 [Verrucomicrobia bacterium]|nr:MAG: hypothetical protein DME86_07930 [Verrucomicrobiota bacterium]
MLTLPPKQKETEEQKTGRELMTETNCRERKSDRPKRIEEREEQRDDRRQTDATEKDVECATRQRGKQSECAELNKIADEVYPHGFAQWADRNQRAADFPRHHAEESHPRRLVRKNVPVHHDDVRGIAGQAIDAPPPLFSKRANLIEVRVLVIAAGVIEPGEVNQQKKKQQS